MGFYEEQKMAYQAVEKVLRGNQKKGLEINWLLTEILLNYSVSERAIRGFIELLCRSGKASLDNGKIRWEVE